MPTASLCNKALRAIPLIALLSMLLAGCASTVVLHEASAEVVLKPVSIQEAFKGAEALHLPTSRNISVFAGKVPLVSLGNNHLFSIPIVNDGSRPHIMKVKSYVARKKDGSYILFYPVLSFVDQNFNAYLTIKPKYEFAFHKSILTNEFEVPAGVERLLIHTDQEFFSGSFKSTTSTGISPSAGVGTAVGVLGGLVGGLILHAATSGEEIEFRFDEVGVVRIEID